MTQRNSRAFPGVKVLAVRTGLERSAIYEALLSLRKHGLITPREVERPGKYRTYTVTEYSLAMPIPAPSSVRHSGPYSDSSEAGSDRAPSTPADTSVQAGGPCSETPTPTGIPSSDQKYRPPQRTPSSTPADGKYFLEDLKREAKASTGGPQGERPPQRTVRTSTPSTAEVIDGQRHEPEATLAGIRRHVTEVLAGDGALSTAVVQQLVAIAARSGIGDVDAHRAITEAVAASSHPFIGKAIQVFGAEVIEVVVHG